MHFKSFNETALKSSVRSQVFIPMDDVELNHPIDGPLTFSLRELVAAVQLWDEVFPERNVEVFEGGAGNPLIFCIETDEVKSTLVTATLDIAASETLDQINEQSYLQAESPRRKRINKRK